MKKIVLFAVFACLAPLLILCPCEAKRDTLVVSIGTQPMTCFNPAYTSSRQILVLYHNWGDTLLYRDPARQEVVPCLAESFEWVGPNLIEFILRKGVRFHNGEAFEAKAVRFSLELLKGPGSLVSDLFAGFEEVAVLDAHTVRIKTATTNPAALEVIANILFIYPPEYYQRVGKEGFDRHPIGTGPYRFVSCETPSEAVFSANPEYFGGPKGKALIPHLKVVSTQDEILQMEALISGRADLLRSTSLYQKQIPFVKKNPGLKVMRTGILRTYFLSMDAVGRSGVEFFKDKRVRMAVNHAINKERLVKQGFNGYADTSDTITSPLHFGHEPDVVRYWYDPARARRLLSEAGYADGFSVDFFAGVNESAAEFIVRDLKAVGITARLHWMASGWERFYKEFLEGRYPLSFMTWGSYSICDAGAILNPFFVTGVPGCYGTTPEISGMIAAAGLTTDRKQRQALFSITQKRIAAEAFCVPLCRAQAISVMNKDLNFTPSYDEIDRYFTASWD